MNYSFTKVVLTNGNRTPFVVSNLMDVNELEGLIYQTLEDNKGATRVALGTIIAKKIQPKVLGRATCNPASTAIRADRIVIDITDELGNVKNLWIFVAESGSHTPSVEIPDIDLHDFYIGSASGSGIKATTLGEFIEYIIDEAKTLADNGAKAMTITIEEE